MKNMKNYESFVNENYKIDESWRQVKAWLQIPKILMERLLSIIIDFVPNLGTLYDKVSAKVDTGSVSGSGQLMKEEPIKLTLEDVENEKLRKTLKMTGVFSEWNVYTFDRTYEGRQPIYISKDELKKGDRYHGERISDSVIDKNYVGRGQRRFFKSKGVEKLSELESQFWVVVALHTEEHEEMGRERDVRYNKKTNKAIEKLVNDAIKEADFTGRSSNIVGHWNNYPIVFKIVDADNIVLMQKFIDACEEMDGKEGVEEMMRVALDYEGWEQNYDTQGSFNDIKTLLKTAKSDEMKELIKKYIGEDAKY